MAFDGSLKFDTKVDTSGFDEGSSTLKNAMEKLTSTIERLSDNIVKSFNGAGRAVEDTGSSAESTASQVEDIADAAKKAQLETQELKKQMEGISIDTGTENNKTPETEMPQTQDTGASYRDYGTEVQEFVDNYVANMGKAQESTNEFRREIDSLSGQLKQMESQGMYFGDEEYDETFMKLAKVKQALVDYKKEMLSPAEGPKFDSGTMQGQIDSLKRRLEQLSNQGKTFGDDLYDSTFSALKKAEGALNEYQKKLAEPTQVKVEFDDSTLQGKVDSLKQQLNELAQSGKSFGDELYDSTYKALNQAQTALNDYKRDLVKPVEIPVNLDPDSFEGQKQQLKAKLSEMESKGITLGNADYDSTYVALQKVIQAESEYKRSLMQADKGQQEVKKSADSMKKSMDKVGKSTKGAGKGMSLLGMIGRSILFSFVFKAISGVTNAVKEGIQNIAQYSGDANGILSSFTSSLLYLKNSFATAFAPILGIVVPALNIMIDAIARAVSWIGQLIAALSGQSTFIKAVKTQEDYAASLKKTGSAAKKAGKDAQKSLAPFDQLNQLSDKKSSDSGSGSGTDPSDMFETVKIDSKIKDMTDGIKSAFSNLLSWAQTNFGPSLSKVWDDMIPNIENFKSIMAGMWSDIGTLGEPLKIWLNNDFVPFLQQVIQTGGVIINGLFDSFNMVFSDIWNLVVFPILQNFITTGLPMLTQFGTQAVSAFEVLFKEVKDIFDMLWKDAAAPALEFLTKIWTDCVDSLAKVWDQYGTPIFDAIKTAFEKTGDTIQSIWKSYLKPVFDTFMDVADRVWIEHLKPLLDNFLEFGAKLILVGLDIYNGLILPLISWFADKLGPIITQVIQAAIEIFGQMEVAVSAVINSILLVLNGLLDFLHIGFTQGWDKAWSEVGNIFKNVFNGIIEIAENAINYIVDSLNRISFDVPDWIPRIGGEHFGLSLDRINLPRLATGTVVPPRAGEFAAILGDNNTDTEVVSPLGTMKQAMLEAIAQAGGLGGGNINLQLFLDSRLVYEAMVEKNKQILSNTGVNPLMG